MAARVRAEDVAPGEVGPELIEVVRDLEKRYYKKGYCRDDPKTYTVLVIWET